MGKSIGQFQSRLNGLSGKTLKISIKGFIMNECIITNKYNCPHKEISGKTCSSCKIPDKNNKLLNAIRVN